MKKYNITRSYFNSAGNNAKSSFYIEGKVPIPEASVMIFLIQRVTFNMTKMIEKDDICCILAGKSGGKPERGRVDKRAWKNKTWDNLYNPKNRIVEDPRLQ